MAEETMAGGLETETSFGVTESLCAVFGVGGAGVEAAGKAVTVGGEVEEGGADEGSVVAGAIVGGLGGGIVANFFCAE
jgi:hypothetical protein